ncbi:MAG: translation initiation factor Sui1 [Phycisphaerae bacterium]|nr:translation initiation factor Sui1 [Phycisphaerae bacterium]
MIFKNSNNLGLVFSTDGGKMCPKCSKAVDKCACKDSQQVIKGDGNVRVGRQTKGRKGKGVTTISGLPLAEDELKELAKKLKNKCGCGGTVKDCIIEIQGDQRDKLIDELDKLGYKAKRSGG